MCKFCLSVVKDYSKHNITVCGMDDINKFDLDSFDILHIHQVPLKQFFNIKTKIIYDIHNFILNCPTGGYFCQILNKYLEKPLICTNCLGSVGVFTGYKNMENIIRFSKRADKIVTHSDFMSEFYHQWNPVTLPLPLQTDLLKPCHEKEDYLLYSGRLSFEKNPWGFVDIINKTNYKGKMILYTLAEDISNSESHYKSLIEIVNNHKNIELILNPSIPEMIRLVQHAKFTVLPYLFSEPFGIAAINSVLCNTPLVVFPYGNLRNMTSLLPRTQEEMIQTIKINNKQYSHILEETSRKREELIQVHNPKNAIKIWDRLYDNIYEEKN